MLYNFGEKYENFKLSSKSEQEKPRNQEDLQAS